MAAQQPNVLFLMADQHNAKCLGHKGHPQVQTPNLDRLAADGVRFDNAITQCTICMPSRMSLISGQYCHNHGQYGFGGSKPAGLPTVFGHFRRHGYRTGAIGWIHCPAYWVEDDCDEFHDTTLACSVDGRTPAYTSYLRQRNIEHLEDHTSLPEFGLEGKQKLDGRASSISFEDSTEGWSVQQSLRFMQQCQAQGAPFFLQMSMGRPHQCFTPAQQFWDMYRQEELTLPPNADYDMTGQSPLVIAHARRYREKPWWVFEPATYEAARLRRLHGYLGNVSHVDHAVGQLMGHLKELGIADNTIIVYGSDHGDYSCEHGLMEKSPGISHDAVTRVPLIWHWPGKLKAGHVASEIVENIDVAPTLCALAGLEPMLTADGYDLSAQLQGQAGDADRIGVTEFAWSRSIRKGRHRLVYYPRIFFEKEYPQGFGELYDLQDDPWEMRNLYFDEASAPLIRQMRDDMLDWLVTTTRPRTVLGIGEPPEANRTQIQTRHKAWACQDGKLPAAALARAVHQGQRYYL